MSAQRREQAKGNSRTHSLTMLDSGQGNHSSASDPDRHSTILLKDAKMANDGQAVAAHIYNDNGWNYIGHRIFTTPIDTLWGDEITDQLIAEVVSDNV